MTDKTIKCSNYSKCGSEWNFVPIKGSNNTELCSKCGSNICFICGKKETRTEWREDEDCCGNKVMREREVEMFNQYEKDENDPEMELIVYYCEGHKEEALKSLHKWTKEDTERKIQREKEKEVQKKQEKEERLNNQKNLFCCEGRIDENKEGQKYGVFFGVANGQKYYLMVPTNHPICKSTDPAVKKILNNIFWSEAEDFFVVNGVESIPIEEIPSEWVIEPQKWVEPVGSY